MAPQQNPQMNLDTGKPQKGDREKFAADRYFGNMLDHTVFLWGCDHPRGSDSDKKYPIHLAGDNSLGFKHGDLHNFESPRKKPLANIFVSMGIQDQFMILNHFLATDWVLFGLSPTIIWSLAMRR